MGIFSRTCLIKELYEDLCYCVTSDLPTSVCRYVLFLWTYCEDICPFFLGGGPWCAFWFPTTGRHFYRSLGSDSCHHCVWHLVVLSSEIGSGLSTLVRLFCFSLV